MMVTYQISSRSIEKFARKRAKKCLLPTIPVTLNEGLGHSHWYQTMQLSGVYFHKHERNWYVNANKQANVKGFFFVCLLFFFQMKSPQLEDEIK